MELLFLAVSFCASAIGAITGIGGGVLIKPVLDAAAVLPVSSISFLSGCTVLCMTMASLIRNRKSPVRIDRRRTVFLAVGAAVGGVAGKYLFNAIKLWSGAEAMVGAIQSVVLGLTTAGVFVYMLFRQRIATHNVSNWAVCLLCGLLLGILSAFLGIGGGPINLVMLYYLFSMDTKTAALNSIYIILFSQAASLLWSLVTWQIPAFPPLALAVMAAGGVCGGLAGSGIVRRLHATHMDKIFMTLLVIIVGICVFNVCNMLT